MSEKCKDCIVTTYGDYEGYLCKVFESETQLYEIEDIFNYCPECGHKINIKKV